MSQKLVQSQSMQQVQTLSPQQVLQVRLLEMPVSELEQRVKNELIDNGALEKVWEVPRMPIRLRKMSMTEQMQSRPGARLPGWTVVCLPMNIVRQRCGRRWMIIGLGRCAGLSVAGTGEGKTVRKRWTMATRHLSMSR